METFVHYEAMFALILIAVIAVFLPLASLFGADSRFDEVARRRRNHG